MSLRGEHERRVLDVGAGDNPVPEATATLDQLPGADYQADLEEEWPLPDNSVQKVVARHVVEHLDDPAHFFTEAARVVERGGHLRIVVPLGEWGHTDHDHVHKWRWNTPKQFCVEQQRPWDPETSWKLLWRDLDTHLGGPLEPLTPLWKLAERRWPNWAAHRCLAGELTAVYRRVADE